MTTNTQFSMRPSSGAITLQFGVPDELHPYGHAGVDFAANLDDPIYAPCDAVVRDVFSVAIVGTQWAQQFKSTFGNCVILAHGDTVTLYGHMNSTAVTEGQAVKSGQVIGYAGKTGLTDGGVHLHWGMAWATNPYLNFDKTPVGTLFNPLDFMANSPDNNQKAKELLQQAINLL